MKKCPMCSCGVKFFMDVDDKKYYQCEQCSAISLDPAFYLSLEDEKARYQKHNNNVEDAGYQKFVEPIVLQVLEKFGTEHQGLDFGAGTGPVVSKLLREKGYKIELYDPFFWNNPGLLEKKYDFIVCCEVMEHFHFPHKEFSLLRSLLKTGGKLFCMTSIFSEEINFKQWYYKNDETHVFFYHRNTLDWIKTHLKFSGLELNGRLMQFFV